MQSGSLPSGNVRFGDFEVDFRTGVLRRRGALISVQGKPLTVLATLLQRPGELVSREDLHKALWPGETFVDYDKNLGVAVMKLREILEDSALQPRFIETIPRRGYRFVGRIEPNPTADTDPAIAEQTSTQLFSPNEAASIPSDVFPEAFPAYFAPLAARRFDDSTTRWHRLPRSIWGVGIIVAVVLGGPYLFSRFQPVLIASTATALRRVNPEAQQDYLKAKKFSDRWILNDVKSALIFDDRAIALEPTYAPAFALRSSLLFRLGGMGVMDNEQAASRARADALRAIELDPQLASGYVSLAEVQMKHDWDLAGTEATLAKGRRLAPNDVSTLAALAALTRSRSQLDESISLQRQVIALDPLEGELYGSLGIRLFAAGRLDEALTAHQRALELDPQLEYIHLNRAEILLVKGLPTEGLREVEEEPGEVWRMVGKALVLHDLGRNSESDAALQQLIATHPAEPYVIACVYAYRGEQGQAFVWLDRAFETRDLSLDFRTDPLLWKLHSDPRFGALIRRMNMLP